MPIPRSVIGTRLPVIQLHVERGRLALFAKATGETGPLYLDVEAARAAGHPDVLVPPTFLFGVELEQPEPFGWVATLGVDMKRVLHGAQGFRYAKLAYAGDTLVATTTFTDIYTKKNGDLEFIERQTDITRQGELIAELHQTTVVRHAA